MEKRRVGYVRPADMNGRLNVQLEMREDVDFMGSHV